MKKITLRQETAETEKHQESPKRAGTMIDTRITTIATADSFVNAAQRALCQCDGMLLDTRRGSIDQLDELEGSAPDVLLLQNACEQPAGFDAIAKFVDRNPATSVVLVCPAKDPDIMMKALHAGVKEFLFEPVQDSEIATVVKRLAALRLASHAQRPPSEVMAFIPCKGGSGATFLAANLAHILAAQYQKRVLLLDLNLQFGDAYLFLMDRMPPSTLAEVCNGFRRLDAAFLESACTKLPSGLYLLPAPNSPADAEIIKPEHIEAIVALARLHYDFVILDVGRMLDSVAIKALDLADHIYPVLQLTLPYLRDAKRMQDIFQKLNYSERKLRWIINRYGAKEELSVADEKRVLAEAFWTVPNDHQHVSLSVNQGIPIAQQAPNSPCGKSLSEWASRLVSAEAGVQRGSWLGRLFRR